MLHVLATLGLMRPEHGAQHLGVRELEHGRATRRGDDSRPKLERPQLPGQAAILALARGCVKRLCRRGRTCRRANERQGWQGKHDRGTRVTGFLSDMCARRDDVACSFTTHDNKPTRCTCTQFHTEVASHDIQHAQDQDATNGTQSFSPQIARRSVRMNDVGVRPDVLYVERTLGITIRSLRVLRVRE